MSTSKSPISVLRRQASITAAHIKRLERGEAVPAMDPAGKIAASKDKGVLKFAVVMGDKTVLFEMSWFTIKELTEHQLAQMILANMTETLG